MRDRPIRVAMIGQKGYPPIHGGIEKHVAELAARLAPRGVDVTLYSRPHYSDADGPTNMPGITVRRLASVPTKHLDTITHVAAATGDALIRGYDVVHYHALGPALLSGIPRWFRRGRSVVTVHGLDWQREKWGPAATRVLRLGEWATTHFPDRVIVVSRALADHYRSRHGIETRCIPNGISEPVRREPRLMRELGLEGGHVLFVGRLVPEKGCHLLLSAYARLSEASKRRHPLVIAGGAGFTDDYVEKLRNEAPPETRFTGFVHGPLLDELYSNAALVVLPSTLEGLSIALLEGMSYGKCCLVSDIPPNLEAGADAVPTFRSGDVEDLSRVLRDLLDAPQTRDRYGAAARTRVLAEYSWERAAEATLKVYRGLAHR